MHSKNINIKSIDDLKREAINGKIINRYVDALARSIEVDVKSALRNRDSSVIIPIIYGTYILDCFDEVESTKIMVYNILQVLSKQDYPVEIVNNIDGYYIHINLEKYCGKKIHEMLDSYLNQYKKK